MTPWDPSRGREPPREQSRAVPFLGPLGRPLLSSLLVSTRQPPALPRPEAGSRGRWTEAALQEGRVKGFLSWKELCVRGRQAVPQGGRAVGYLCLKVKSLMPSGLCSAHCEVLSQPAQGPFPPLLRVPPRSLWRTILPSTLNPCGWGTSLQSWPWRGAHSPALASESTASPGQRLVQVLPVRDTLGFLAQSLEIGSLMPLELIN